MPEIKTLFGNTLKNFFIVVGFLTGIGGLISLYYQFNTKKNQCRISDSFFRLPYY